ncbi:MAG: hypothetical protein LBK60_06500 [Verrucomicrobiales bacterium]|jgi:hypothetical protein|nr:hypothetical protein [Verrucomicrobiales bacterium]
MQIKSPPLPRHRGLPVYSDADLRQAFPHLLDDPTVYLAIKPDGLTPDGAAAGLLDHKIIGLRALAARAQLNDSVRQIEDYLQLHNIAEEDARVLDFVAQSE